MHKIAIIALCTLPLFAGFFPQTVHTSVSSVDKKSVTLTQPLPIDGMSGVVVHHYSNNLNAITARIVQLNTTKIRLLNSNIIHHDKLPTINTPVHIGDEVIGGYLYDNILLLAPDAQTYSQITSMDSKNWIHPDLFALYLSKIGDTIPTKENLKTFAKDYQVGLIYIITKDSAKLLDPISGKIVGTKSMSGLPAKGEAPFFMRFDEIESGMFSSSNTKSYYKIMSAF